MNCDATCAGKFYSNFKVLKSHINIPPERAIFSQNCSVTANIGKYVDFYIQTAKQHDSYLEDTIDFICRIEKINNSSILPHNAIIVTRDVISLFTIIPQEEGLECTRNALNKLNKPDVLTEILMRLLEVNLKDSIFLNFQINSTNKMLEPALAQILPHLLQIRRSAYSACGTVAFTLITAYK